MKKMLFIMSNLQTRYYWTKPQETSGYSTAPNTASSKAWDLPMEYPNRESKHDIKSPNQL